MSYEPESHDNHNFNVTIAPYEDRQNSTKHTLARDSTLAEIGQQYLADVVDHKQVTWYYLNRYKDAVAIESTFTLGEMFYYPHFAFNSLRNKFDLLFSVGTGPNAVKRTVSSGSVKRASSQVVTKLTDGHDADFGREAKVAKREDLRDELLEIQKILPDRD